jgi:hypothetical protein
MNSPPDTDTFSNNQSNDCHITRSPIIHPKDRGAKRVLPSILSVFENRSIILGNSILLDTKPAEVETPISRIRNPNPKVEKS